MIEPISRQLTSDQLKAFDTDYLAPEMWESIEAHIRRDFPDGVFSFLDIGGGNGRFADQVLLCFPEATGIVLDNGDALLEVNRPHPRKLVLRGAAEELDRIFPDKKFDLIFLNWILHHLVGSTHRECKRLQRRTISSCRKLLTPSGRISVLENLYEGGLFPNLPGWIIYQLTSRKEIARLIRKLGANTAGCGVCFLSQREWEDTFQRAGLTIASLARFNDWKVSLLRRLFLHIRSIRVGEFWIQTA